VWWVKKISGLDHTRPGRQQPQSIPGQCGNLGIDPAVMPVVHGKQRDQRSRVN
jgi:hypothetical protein